MWCLLPALVATCTPVLSANLARIAVDEEPQICSRGDDRCGEIGAECADDDGRACLGDARFGLWSRVTRWRDERRERRLARNTHSHRRDTLLRGLRSIRGARRDLSPH